MDQDICLPDFVESALESFYQLCGEFSDEADGVAKKEGYVFDDYFPYSGV